MYGVYPGSELLAMPFGGFLKESGWGSNLYFNHNIIKWDGVAMSEFR